MNFETNRLLAESHMGLATSEDGGLNPSTYDELEGAEWDDEIKSEPPY